MRGDDDAETDDELRKELEEACAKVRQQIDSLDRTRFSRAGGYGGDDLALERLNTALAQLEEALANLGPADA